MHPLAERHFEKVLGKGELLGIDKSCKYYPCHHGGLEDCTFCFCPFYPCGDESTAGKWIKGTSWSCEDCSWIHHTEVAGRVLITRRAEFHGFYPYLLITRRAEFHGFYPWVNENSPEGRQAKLEL